jgi:uncharacterized protein YkwD
MRFSSVILVLTACAFAACASESEPTAVVGQSAPPTVQSPEQGAPPSNDEIARQLFGAVNQQRSTNGLKPLEISSELSASAQEHSDKMSAGNFLSTRGADEASVVTRVTSHNVKTLKLGENVVRMKIRPDRLADETISMWMAAAADRKNILSPAFTRTGIGVALAPDGDYYISADFAQ